MVCNNLPLQVIVHYDAEGVIHPLRFQFRSPGKGPQTVTIEQVADVRRVETDDGEARMFLCKDDSHMYELKYTLHDQKWILFRQIY